jgi:Family of unknown function (DUF6088)
MILGSCYVLVSFHGHSGLVSQAEEGECPGACAVPGEVAAGGGVVAVAGADPGGVFAECCVTDVLQGSRGRPAVRSSRLRSQTVSGSRIVKPTLEGDRMLGSPGVAATVRATVTSSSDRFWRPADFEGSRSAVEQALHRLASTDDLRCVRKGLYWRGTKTLLGMAPPPAEEMVKAVVPEKRGIGPAGASAANALGLSTQMPANPIFAIPARVPSPVPGIKMVSRTGCRGRVKASARAAEVALLEVLRDWAGLVEVDSDVAIGIIRSRFAEGALRPAVLAKVARTEPRSVRDGLAKLLGECGYSHDAASVSAA